MLEFPKPQLIRQLLENSKLEQVLDTFADILTARIYENNVDGLDKVCESYLDAADTFPEVAANTELRKVTSALVFQYNVILGPRVDTVWDIVSVYGPSNVTLVKTYLDGLAEHYHNKIGRLVKALAEHEQVQDFKQKLEVLYLSSFVDIVTPDFLTDLQDMKTQMASIARKLSLEYAESQDVRNLKQMFPQLTTKHANELLQTYTVEQVTMKLLDDPSSLNPAPNAKAGKDKQKKPKKFVQLSAKDNKEAASQQRDDRFIEKTLRLAYSYDEEDPDDTVDVQASDVSAADRKNERKEALLYSIYASNPALFDKSARGSKERSQLRENLQWTNEQIEGWASMLKRSPDRKSKLTDIHVRDTGAYEGEVSQESTGNKETRKQRDQKLRKQHSEQKHAKRGPPKPGGSKPKQSTPTNT